MLMQQMMMVHALMPNEYYDCDGVCLSDSNGNGICDELEIYGCMSDWADNYLDNATTDDGSCYLLVVMIQIILSMM